MNPMFFGHNVVGITPPPDNAARNKRASILGLDGSYRMVLPVPDGAVHAADRWQLAGKYPQP